MMRRASCRALSAIGRKAAVVVRLLLNEGADIPLGGACLILLQEQLTHQLGQMGLVDRGNAWPQLHKNSPMRWMG